jgi:hypothetical protein
MFIWIETESDHMEVPKIGFLTPKVKQTHWGEFWRGLLIDLIRFEH